MKRTTKELMGILGVKSNKSAIEIANKERWRRKNDVGNGGMHSYDVSDAQLRVYFDKKHGRIKHKDTDPWDTLVFLQCLIDKRVCAVSFNTGL